jgi:hypothetical protein
MDKLQEDLIRPFKECDIEWRVQSSGLKGNGDPWLIVLAYVTNRAIQERLDSVFGVYGWKNEYKAAPDGGVLCGISVYYNNEWMTKWDGAENTNIESVKGGLSGAMKRAAVQWGIGRYLYNLEATFAEVCDDGENTIFIKQNNKKYKWKTPTLPCWALPKDKGDLSKAKENISKINNQKMYDYFEKWCDRFVWTNEEEQVIRSELESYLQ